MLAERHFLPLQDAEIRNVRMFEIFSYFKIHFKRFWVISDKNSNFFVSAFSSYYNLEFFEKMAKPPESFRKGKYLSKSRFPIKIRFEQFRIDSDRKKYVNIFDFCQFWPFLVKKQFLHFCGKFLDVFTPFSIGLYCVRGYLTRTRFSTYNQQSFYF